MTRNSSPERGRKLSSGESSLGFNRPEISEEKQPPRPQSVKPVRPKEWQPPKERPLLSMEIKFVPPTELHELPSGNLTVVSIHPPRKSQYPHLQRRIEDCDVFKGLSISEIPIGEYLVMMEFRGYRPFARTVTITRKHPGIHLRMPPPLRVTHPHDQRNLIRPGESHPFLRNVRAFMKRFGYEAEVERSKGGCMRCEKMLKRSHLDLDLEMMLRLFQKTWRLEVTGGLTIDTLAILLAPRCAHVDFPITPEERGPESSSAGPPGTNTQDPITFTGNRWDQFNLRYLRLTGTGDISNEWSIIDSALDRWAEVSPLSFTRTEYSAQSHIELDFRRSSESDYPFDQGGDKDGNTLAHAYGPPNGLVEFDDHEDWGSTSLAAVATHELGHALGLRHSSVKEATMYAWYDSGQASLHEVDVRGIKSLYAPVYHHSGPFVHYPLFGFNATKGTDSVTIDLGQTRHFLAWGSVTMIDSLNSYDRDNWHGIDVYEIDGQRTSWRVSGGDHLGSANAPSNIYEGVRIGYGQRITFRLSAGHVSDLEVAGVAMVLVL